MSNVLFIHGYPQEGSFWNGQLEALRAHHKVLAPDLRGAGADRRPLPEAMTMEAYAADLKQLLDDAGIQRAVLCGLSMGGYIALAFVEHWPHRLSGLVLCHTKADADDAAMKKARELSARQVLAEGTRPIADSLLPKLMPEPTRAERPRLVKSMHDMMLRQDPHAVAAAARGMALRPDRTALLPRIAVPTLLIAGDEDPIVPLATMRSMHAAIPGSRIEVMKGIGHLGNQEAPDLFNQKLAEFLEQVENRHA